MGLLCRHTIPKTAPELRPEIPRILLAWLHRNNIFCNIAQKLLPIRAGIAEKFLAEIPRHFTVYFIELPVLPRLNDNSPDNLR